jgi:tripartite-type tricarboxylate transporter receptor subunit TctC
MATAAGTSPAIVKRLHTEVANYMLNPDTQKKLTAMGAEVDIKTGAEMRKILPLEIAKWTKVAIAANMPRDTQ